MDTDSNNSEAEIIMNQYSEIFHFSWDQWRPFDFVVTFFPSPIKKIKNGNKAQSKMMRKTPKLGNFLFAFIGAEITSLLMRTELSYCFVSFRLRLFIDKNSFFSHLSWICSHKPSQARIGFSVTLFPPQPPESTAVCPWNRVTCLKMEAAH